MPESKKESEEHRQYVPFKYTCPHTLSEILTLLWEETHLSLTSGKTGFHLSFFALSEILSTECKDAIGFTQKQDYLFRKIQSGAETK